MTPDYNNIQKGIRSNVRLFVCFSKWQYGPTENEVCSDCTELVAQLVFEVSSAPSQMNCQSF